MKYLTNEEWFKDMPELIYKLKKNYGFYYSGHYTSITRHIKDVLNPKKHKHKIILYENNKIFYLVVYRKSGPNVYYTDIFRDSSWRRIYAFINLFKQEYNRAERDLENDLYRDGINNGL